MKKTTTILMMLLLSIMTFTSCSQDDKTILSSNPTGTELQDRIIGNWEFEKGTSEYKDNHPNKELRGTIEKIREGLFGNKISFKENGQTDQSDKTYTTKGNSVTIHTFTPDGKGTPYSYSAPSVTLSNNDNTMTIFTEDAYRTYTAVYQKL